MGLVYCLTNKVNGKKYVGCTTTSIKDRMNNHRAESKRKPHIPLYSAMNKYGFESFFITILEEVDNDKLSEREMFWIDKLNTFDREYGYNATLGGRGGHNIYTEKDKKQIIEYWKSGMTIRDINKKFGFGEKTISSIVGQLPTFKERTQNIITERIRKAKGRSIKQYTINGDFVKEYETLSDAAKSFGGDCAYHIHACCKNKNYTCFGFLFRYSEDDPPEKGIRYGKRRIVDQYSQSGDYIATYKTMTEAAKAVNGKPGSISEVCNHHQNIAYGYVWRHHGEPFAIAVAN